MYIPPERDFRPDDGETYEYDCQPDDTVWRLAVIYPLVTMVLLLALAPTTLARRRSVKSGLRSDGPA